MDDMSSLVEAQRSSRRRRRRVAGWDRRQVVVPEDQSCIDPDRICDIGWGQARP
jgi:hypothetical protein